MRFRRQMGCVYNPKVHLNPGQKEKKISAIDNNVEVVSVKYELLH